MGELKYEPNSRRIIVIVFLINEPLWVGLLGQANPEGLFVSQFAEDILQTSRLALHLEQDPTAFLDARVDFSP